MIRTVRIRNGKATIKSEDGALLSVEVDPAANGRLVTFNGEFVPTEGTDFTDSQGNQRIRATFKGKVEAVPQLTIPGISQSQNARKGI